MGEGLNDGDNEFGAEGEDERNDVSSDLPQENGTNNDFPSPRSDQTVVRAGSLESELFIYTGRMRALHIFRAEESKADEEINLIRAATFVGQHALLIVLLLMREIICF